MSIDFDRIKQLVSIVEENRLSELAIEEGDVSITIKAEDTRTAPVALPVAQSSAHIEIQPCEGSLEVEMALSEPVEYEEPASEHLFRIESPMVGVFYRRSAPDSPTFVEIGDIVEDGQTVGIIEAMKVFSEVPAEVSGRVVDVPVESGKLVQQGDVLVVIDTSEAEA